MNLIVQPKAHVKSIDDPAGAVLLNLDTGVYYSMNRLGSDIWLRLRAGTDVPTLVSEISGKYAVEPQRVENDTIQFIDRLASAGLVDVEHR